PLLCKPVPDVSRVRVTVSFKIATSTLYKLPFSGILPATPCFNFNRSAIDFLTIALQSLTLNNLDLCDFPETGNCPFSSIYFSQGKSLVFSNNSSKVYALNSPTTNFTLSATLNQRLLLAMAEESPSKITFPFSTSTSYPKSRTS